MDLPDYSTWIIKFYQQRGWYDYDSFIRVGFLTEEVGEVSRAIRSLEIGRDRPDEVIQSDSFYKENLMEELGDVFSNLLILADKYAISLEDITTHHRAKLEARFKDQ